MLTNPSCMFDELMIAMLLLRPQVSLYHFEWANPESKELHVVMKYQTRRLYQVKWLLDFRYALLHSNIGCAGVEITTQCKRRKY
jgi:hypothetical protein